MVQKKLLATDKKIQALAKSVKQISKKPAATTKPASARRKTSTVTTKKSAPARQPSLARVKVPEYLVAPKETIALWFRAYQLILNSSDKKITNALKKHKKFYKLWGTDKSITFEKWWQTKSALFEDKSSVEVVKNIKKDANHIHLSVPLNKKLETIVAQFKEQVKPVLIEAQKKNLVIKHKFSPTTMKGMKTNKIIMLLDLYDEVFNQTFKDKKEQAYKLCDVLNRPKYAEKVPGSLQKYHEVYEAVEGSNTLIKTIVDNVNLKELSNAKRYINRYKQKVNKLLLNVAEGKFPGKY